MLKYSPLPREDFFEYLKLQSCHVSKKGKNLGPKLDIFPRGEVAFRLSACIQWMVGWIKVNVPLSANSTLVIHKLTGAARYKQASSQQLFWQSEEEKTAHKHRISHQIRVWEFSEPLKTANQCVYLHPFFLMILPRTISALQESEKQLSCYYFSLNYVLLT